MLEEKLQADKELEEQKALYEKYPSLLSKLEEAAIPLQKFFGIYSEEITRKLQVRLECNNRKQRYFQGHCILCL